MFYGVDLGIVHPGRRIKLVGVILGLHSKSFFLQNLARQQTWPRANMFVGVDDCMVIWMKAGFQRSLVCIREDWPVGHQPPDLRAFVRKMNSASTYRHKQWPSKQLTITNRLIFEKPVFLPGPLEVMAVPFEPCGSDHMILKTCHKSKTRLLIARTLKWIHLPKLELLGVVDSEFWILSDLDVSLCGQVRFPRLSCSDDVPGFLVLMVLSTEPCHLGAGYCPCDISVFVLFEEPCD